MKTLPYRVKGFMLPVAIFMMVILAALVGYSMRLSMLANMGTLQDVQGAQAYLAARGGVEWAAYQVLQPGSTTMQTCPTIPSPFVLNGYTLAITCTRSLTNDKGGSQSIGIYTITSTATLGTAGTQNYTERQIRVTLSRCLFGTEECN